MTKEFKKSNLEFGNKIKQLRKSKGLTQEKLSELIGIDNKHLSRIETGAHYPTFPVMRKLAIALDIDLYKIDDINIKNTPDNFLMKSLQILNSAKTTEEKRYYYKILSVAKLGLKLGTTSNANEN